MSIQPPNPWIFRNDYTQFPNTIGQLAQTAGIKAGNSIYFGHLAKAPVEEMVGKMSFAAESAADSLRHISGISSIPRLPSYWESTTIPDVLNTKGFHLTDTEFRVPFNFDQVSLLKSEINVFFPLMNVMILPSDEVISCLKESISRLNCSVIEVDKFEHILHTFDNPLPTSPPLRNCMPPADFSGDRPTFLDMVVLKSAGLEYPSSISDCRAISMSIKQLDYENTQFFGRISTTGPNDYYLAFVPNGEDEYTYFVRTGFEGDWMELNSSHHSVYPIELISYSFTGHLAGPVLSHPRFLGFEADFLGLIVKHIHTETSVFPMNLEDHTPTKCILVPIHSSAPPKLSSFCRSPPFKSLDRDPIGSWSIEYVGDPNTYVSCKDKDISLGKVVISSIVWPGAHFVLSGYLKRVVNIYIGDGFNHNHKSEFPIMPPLPIQTEHCPGIWTEFQEPTM